MTDHTANTTPPKGETTGESMGMRLLWLVLVAILINVANTVQFVLAVVQFIIMVVNKGTPNKNLADFGKKLGNWFQKAVQYQTAAGTAKPWPWTNAD